MTDLGSIVWETAYWNLWSFLSLCSRTFLPITPHYCEMRKESRASHCVVTVLSSESARNNEIEQKITNLIYGSYIYIIVSWVNCCMQLFQLRRTRHSE